MAEFLIRELARQRPDMTIDVFVPFPKPKLVDSRGWPDNVRFRRFQAPLYRTRLGRSLWEQLILPILIRSAGYQLLLNPSNSAPVLLSPKAQQLVILHDVSFLNREWVTASFSHYLSWIARRISRKRIPVVTSSNHSCEQIRSHYPAVRISAVVPPACSEPTPRARPSGIRPPYVLVIGSANPRKNIERAVRGFLIFSIRTRDPSPELLVIGPEDERIFRRWARPRPSNVRWLGPVSEAEKWRLIEDARVVLVPSLDEGFGIPVLEALRVGTPVVASRIPAFEENYGDSLEYVDPRDERDIARGLTAVFDSEIRRNELSRHGRQVASRYTWERSGAVLLEVLDSLVRES